MTVTNLSQVKKFYIKNKRLPTYSEISRILGFASRNSAHRLMQKWLEEGLVQKVNRQFSPTNKFFSLPLIGSVKAGVPTLADSQNAEPIELHNFLLGNSGQTYILEISGDSMVDAGIQPGDLAVIDPDKDPINDSIVVAMVDGAWTLKRFRRVRKQIILYPENPLYKPIVAHDSLVIGGVVISIIRKYRF